MLQPKVSVIICTYNQQEFVREAIESALRQTYPHIEIIVADDASTDDTPRILREYEQRFPGKVRAALGDRNTGIPSNFNRGLALRTGELMVCLDGDDIMLPLKIDKQVAFLRQNPHATGCYHDAEVFDSETGRTLGLMSRLYNGTDKLKQGRLRDWFVPRNFFLPSSIMFRASACPPLGFDERMKYLSEVVFYAQVFRTGTLLAINEPLVKYRRHLRNITDDSTARSLSQEYELLAYAILEARYPELYPILKKLRISCLLTEAVKSHREGDRARSRTIIKNVISQGAFVQGIIVFAGLSFFSQRASELTDSRTFQRPDWVKRLARLILNR